MHITNSKFHDVDALDEIEVVLVEIYVIGNAYIDFARLFKLDQSNIIFVFCAKSNLKSKVVASKNR